MHPHNRYATPYNFERLIKVEPELKPHVVASPEGGQTLDFTNPAAVRLLNRALLLKDYGLQFWDLPPDALCPGVPGRLDYIHAIADLLGEGGGSPKKGAITGLDIGTGSSLIYPILGVREYGWRFVATDVDADALRAAGAIAQFNSVLKGRVEVRQQRKAGSIFTGVVQPGDRFAFTMCNPPFFASAKEAEASAKTKWTKLGRAPESSRNFGGRSNELWTPGGEPAFLQRMIAESWKVRQQVGWFTTLVSQAKYLKALQAQLRKANVADQQVIELSQGNKVSRVLGWRF